MSEIYSKDGEVVSIVNSSISGITIIPPGEVEVEQIPKEEYSAVVEAVEDINRDYVDPKEQKLADLQSQIDEIQQIQLKPTK
jgi:hypothetical protein